MADQAVMVAVPSAAVGHPLRAVGLVVVLLATVLDLLDSLVTTIAGPIIMADLHGGHPCWSG